MAEDPTRRQQAPRDPAGGGRGEVYEEYETEAGPSRAELADRARSSRNWAYGAAFLGLLAAGLAAVAIIFATGDDEGGGSRDGASQSTVNNLRKDVESLQEKVDKIEEEAEGADDVSKQVEDLAGRVSEVESDQKSVSEQVSQLEERVDEVAEAASQGGSGGGGDGGAPEIPNP